MWETALAVRSLEGVGSTELNLRFAQDSILPRTTFYCHHYPGSFSREKPTTFHQFCIYLLVSEAYRFASRSRPKHLWRDSCSAMLVPLEVSMRM